MDEGKDSVEVAAIVKAKLNAKRTGNILVTRADLRTYKAVKQVSPKAEFHELSRAVRIRRSKAILGKGMILVVAAGRGDFPVAEEAVVTAETFGNRVEFIHGIGVTGIDRLSRHRAQFAAARVIICVAGVEGAQPSIVAGLVAAPVIAVPTSAGYGTSLGGLIALLAMLNSSGSNVAVVNIDDGFGAACVASTINRV